MRWQLIPTGVVCGLLTRTQCIVSVLVMISAVTWDSINKITMLSAAACVMPCGLGAYGAMLASAAAHAKKTDKRPLTTLLLYFCIKIHVFVQTSYKHMYHTSPLHCPTIIAVYHTTVWPPALGGPTGVQHRRVYMCMQSLLYNTSQQSTVKAEC